MKIRIVCISFVILLTCSCSKDRSTEDAKNITLQGLERKMAPSKITEEETGFPFYPGAIQTAGGDMGEGIGFVNLLTRDETKEVKEFYDKRLKEYKWHGEYMLYSRDEDPNTTLSNMNEYLSIMEVSQDAADLYQVEASVKKDLKTRIQIVYKK